MHGKVDKSLARDSQRGKQSVIGSGLRVEVNDIDGVAAGIGEIHVAIGIDVTR